MEGTEISSLAVESDSPGTIYAGSNGIVFRSTDSATTWAKVSSEGLPEDTIRGMVISTVAPATRLYAMTGHSGVFDSTDQGVHWKQVTGGLETHRVYDMTVDPLTPSRLYAATVDGLFRSVDQGVTWLASAGGLVHCYPSDVCCVATDPTNPAVVYTGSARCGISRSDDYGLTWSWLPSELMDTAVVSLAVDPLASRTVYASTEYGDLFRSDDRGETWKEIPGVTAVSLLGSSVILIDPVSTSTVYVIGHQGILRSKDGGTTWSTGLTGLTAYYILDVAADPVVPSTVYAGTSIGVARSLDRGATWKWVSLIMGEITSIVIDAKSPSKVYAGTWGNGVFRSIDPEPIWLPASTGLSNADVMWRLAIDPVTPSIIYAGGDGVFRSSDSGGSWTEHSSGLTDKQVTCLVLDPVVPTSLYAGTAENGVFRSDNSGTTWTASSSGLASQQILKLVIDPTSPATVYAGTRNGAYRSDDHAATWHAISRGLTPKGIFGIAVSPASSNTLFAGTSAGAYYSLDGGGSWLSASLGLDPYGEYTVPVINSLAFAMTNPPTLYASAAFGGRLYRWVPPDVTGVQPSPPSMPANVTAAPSVADIRLSWSAATAGTSPLGGYAVYRSSNPGGTPGTAVATVGAAVTSWTDTTCYQGVTYYYAVAAFDNQGTPLFSGKSPEVTATLVPPSPPSVPGNLIATPSVTDVRLSWSASTAGTPPLGGYAVFRSTTAGSLGDTPVATVGAAVTNWTDTTCHQGVTYYYAVAAFDNHLSEKSSEVNAKLLPPPPVVLTLTLQLGNTRMLVTGSDGTSDTVTLDAAPVLGAGNRTLVPVRAVAEAMGGTVDWDAATKTASVTVGSNTLELTLGKNTALFNGTATPIDTDPKVVPVIINGRTMLPLRFVVESLGADVSYDQATKTITITYVKT
jgi:photosystem II stability/assembly factor-like uncharacterized protein